MTMSNVVITDGTSPLTFEPFVGQVGQSDPAQWLEKGHGSFAGYGKLSLLTARTKGAKGAFASSLKLELPKVALVNSVETVVHTALGTARVVVPDTMSLSERTAFAKYFGAAVAHTIMTDSIVNQRVAD